MYSSMNNIKKIITKIINKDMSVAADIDTLGHALRITIRRELERRSIPTPRNLYFDYKKQMWIE